ncbi:hypothetical protein C2U30_07505 [Aeromonas sp. ASNIH5]|nr:hypothetical protein C2U30_07505 [Aeromonas sp. ASNIH5]
MFCLATNQIAQTGLSSLPPVIYYSEQLFRILPSESPGQLLSLVCCTRCLHRNRARHCDDRSPFLRRPAAGTGN